MSKTDLDIKLTKRTNAERLQYYEDKVTELISKITILGAELDKYTKPCEECGGKGIITAEVGTERGTHPCPHCHNGRVAKTIVNDWFVKMLDYLEEEVCEPSQQMILTSDDGIYRAHAWVEDAKSQGGGYWNPVKVLFKLTRIPDMPGMWEITEVKND